MKQRPYAVFDIDGTLIRWQLYHALADTLMKSGVIDKNEYKNVLDARMNWKVRRSDHSFVDYENALIELIDKAFPGMDYESFSNACAEVVNRYRDQVYTFTRDFIAELRQNNYLLFAVSGSPAELVKEVAHHYGFDDYSGTEYEKINGKLSGHKDLLLGHAKAKRLKDLIKKHQANASGSVAVGDTISDRYILEAVEHPIAFNPSSELLEKATQKGWEVVVERKNVVYRLEYDHGRYVLTPTGNRQASIL